MPPLSKGSTAKGGSGDTGTSHRWALVVEDDPNDLDFASEVLRREGFAVMGAPSAARAWRSC